MRPASLVLVLVVVALIVAALALIVGGRAAEGVPRLTFEITTKDFGRVRPQLMLEATFPFRNDGDGSLALRTMSPCCGMRVRVSSYEVPPGGRGYISAVWRPGVDIGDDVAPLAVWSNDPRRRQTELELVATVSPPYRVSPALVDFGEVLFGTEATRRVVIESRDGRPVLLERVSTAVSGVRVACPTAGVGALEHTVALSARPAKPPRFMSGELRIVTDRDDDDGIALPLKLRVVGRVTPEPRKLTFEADAHGEVTRSVTLTGRGDTAFTVAAARVTSGPFRVSYERAPAAQRQRLDVVFVPSATTDVRPSPAQLRIKSDLAGEPELSVPLYVRRPPEDTPTLPADPGAPAGALEVRIYYFSGCRGCASALASARRHALERGDAVWVAAHDVHADAGELPRLVALLDRYPDVPDALPSMVALVGDRALVGTDAVAERSGRVYDEQIALGGEHLVVRRPDGRTPPRGDAVGVGMSLLPVVLAGLADGVNPCAFAAMVLLVSILSAWRTGSSTGEGRTSGAATVLAGGGAFCFGVFATYYVAGLGLLAGVARLAAFPVAEAIVFWSAWCLAVAGAVLSAVDAAVYHRTGDAARLTLRVPEAVRRRFAGVIRGRLGGGGLIAGGMAAGAVIAVMEGVCTGQMYLPMIQYMARTPGLRGAGAAWLFLYNVLFILPLVAILLVAAAGVHFHRLSGFLARHLAASKLGMAVVFAVLAGAMLLGR